MAGVIEVPAGMSIPFNDPVGIYVWAEQDGPVCGNLEQFRMRSAASPYRPAGDWSDAIEAAKAAAEQVVEATVYVVRS